MLGSTENNGRTSRRSELVQAGKPTLFSITCSYKVNVLVSTCAAANRNGYATERGNVFADAPREV